jgi:hypothetical protein
MVCDLLLRFYRADALYAKQLPLESIFHVDASNPPVRSLEVRLPAPAYPLGVFHQVPRYLEFMTLRPYAFSSGYIAPDVPWVVKPSVTETVWRNYRWNSYLLLRHYFQTIYDTKTTAAIVEAFRIAQPPLGFQRVLNTRVWPITYRLLEPGYSRLKVSVDIPGPGYLYFADGYHRFWSAKVDGFSVDPSLSNGAFKAVAISGGRHEVSFSYRPWPFIVGLLFFYMAFAGSLLGILWLSVDHRIRFLSPMENNPVPA